ncbi:MAG: S-layer homology domain-containing protein [Clostridia bacterium]|nr:S-layer homology domain-containing protein [Clostridia bacterium]
MKKIFAILLMAAMILSMIVIPASAECQGNGCATVATVKKTDPKYVIKDGVIGEHEYERVPLNLDPETTDLMMSWHSSTGKSNLNLAKQMLPTLELYVSWDEEHGINVALKFKPVETPRQENDPPNIDYFGDAGFPGDEFIAQLGVMFALNEYDFDENGNPIADSKGNFLDTTHQWFYRGCARRTDTGDYLTGYYWGHGIRVNQDPSAKQKDSTGDIILEYEGENPKERMMNGGTDYVITYGEDGTVTFETSAKFAWFISPDRLVDGLPKENYLAGITMTAVAGGVGSYLSGDECYCVSIGDGGFFQGWKSSDKKNKTLKPGDLIFSYDYLDGVTPPHKHTPGPEATCEEPQICTDCKEIIVPAKGHTPGAEATCTEAQICTACLKELVPAKGHVWDEGTVTKDPTEDEMGTRLFHCVNCEETKTENIPEIGHEHSYDAVVTPPTCTEKGYTTDTCRCGDSYVDTYVDAKGHDAEDEWTTDVAPTTDAEGSKSHHCKVCGEKLDVTPIPKLTLFTDVKEGSWYDDAVRFAAGNGIVGGYEDGTFKPNKQMTRAELVTVLWRSEGSPVVNYAGNFKDVKASSWFKDAVAWAFENGIVNGTSETAFSPNAPITREQIAAIFFRYAQFKGINTDKRSDELKSFPDYGKVHDYAIEPLSWANAEGLIGGNNIGGVNKIDPRGNATRAQVTVILYRYLTTFVK